MKKWFLVVGLLLMGALLLSACGNSGETAEVSQSSGETKEFTIEASNFDFNLKEIKVNQGDTVKITLKSTEGVHAVQIDGYGDEIKEGKTITFVADKKGEFEYICSIFCGEGHGEMVGKLVVQ